MPNKPQKRRPCSGMVFFFVICRKVKRQSKLHSKRDNLLKDCRKRGFCHQLPPITPNYHHLPPFATTPTTPRNSPPQPTQIHPKTHPKKVCFLPPHPHAIVRPNPRFALGRALQRPSRPLCPRLIPRAALSTRSLGAIYPRTHNLGRGSLARSAAEPFAAFLSPVRVPLRVSSRPAGLSVAWVLLVARPSLPLPRSACLFGVGSRVGSSAREHPKGCTTVGSRSSMG